MSQFLSPAVVALALVSLNGATLALFGLDKMKAQAGARRIAESTLLGLALLGGTPGAYAGRAVFRHKTRKQPFSRELHMIAGLQVAALAGGIGWWSVGGFAG